MESEGDFMIEPGELAPDFKLQSDAGKTVSLSDFKGRKVILYFYPKDDTPGCTLEAQNFRNEIDAFRKRGVEILGVSRDSVASHVKFKTKYELPFTLLSDPDNVVCEAYGVWKEKSMYGKKYMGIERTTFLIDEKGKIEKVFPRVKVEGHCDEVLKAI
jgi:thioredoxin-dependent peroxiredoxin